MNIAVILAGGVGSRVGAGMPKQFVKILGKPGHRLHDRGFSET